MSQEIAKKSVTVDMATRFHMEPAAFEATLRATVVPANVTKEQFAAFLLVARKYNLDPVTRQIYAMPTQGGGIQPIVSIDGWMALINSHPQFDGMEFEDHPENGKITAITCRMFRKDRTHPTSVTEYMGECVRSTSTWKQWPARMLRHKAAIQAARYAFGFSGIMEPDEAERMVSVEPEPARPALPHLTDDQFDEQLKNWTAVIESGRMDNERVIAMAGSKYALTEEQRERIRAFVPAVDADWVEQFDKEDAA